MPSWLTREQFKADSIRAFEWFKITKDSSYIDKYTMDVPHYDFNAPVKPANPARPIKRPSATKSEMIAVENHPKKKWQKAIDS